MEALEADDVVDVCVIGAGLAGLTALERLSAAGLKRILLEASSSPGGRLRGRFFCGRWVEEGANWVQGLGTNPVWQKVQCSLKGRYEAGEDTEDGSENKVDSKDRVSFRGLGKAGPEDMTKEATERTKAFEKAMSLVEDEESGEGGPDGPDQDLAQALAQQGWVPASSPIDMAIEFREIDFEYGESPEKVSVQHNVHGEFTWDDFGPDSFFVDDCRGLASICPEVPEGVGSYYNCIVEELIQLPDCVQVQCKDGFKVWSRVALCTVSVGVLNARDILFDPPLPLPMQDALNSMTMCNYTKTFVKLESALWVDDEQYVIRVGKPRGRHVVWQPLAPDLVIVTNTGDEGRRVEKLDPEELKRELEGCLSEMYERPPNILVAEATKWSSDPRFRGSYSFLPTGSMPDGWDVVNERHGRLFFGGEAFHPRWSGYMQGAIGSGEDSADAILQHEVGLGMARTGGHLH